MARRPSTTLWFPPWFSRSTIKRAFWLFMLVFHVGAIRSAWSAFEGISGDAEWLSSGFRFLALLGSAVFFALKIADVTWLRLKPGWRSAVSSLVIVALLHVNVVDRAAAGEPISPPTPLSAILFVAVLIDGEAVRRRGARLWNLAVRAVVDPPRSLSPRSYRHDALWPAELIPPRAWLVSGLLSPRPPPPI